MNYIKAIVNLIKSAQEIASQHGHTNLLQPGLVKEPIIGDIRGHEVHKTKHDADAWDRKDPKKQYEYLTCYETGTFQLDRMFKSPADKRKKSLERIKRCDKFYCAVFYKENPLVVKEIYELEIPVILEDTIRQLDASSNAISHISFTVKWAQKNGKRVYPLSDKDSDKKDVLKLNIKTKKTLKT